MIRWFWRIYFPLAGLILLGMPAFSLGPAIESRFFPVRINNLNLHPVRVAERVCWTWASDKLKLRLSDDVDVHLDVLDGDGKVRNTFVPAFYNSDTGLPWQSGLSVGIGHHDIPYCIDIPRTVRPNDRLRIRFSPIVHGWHDLWSLPVVTPDIVDPPWAEAPP